MKEKLTKLIEQAKYCTEEELAEYLIAAGLTLFNCENKMITNGDKIRAMSDEDLVVLVRAILNVEDCPVPGEHDCEGCFFNTLCSHFGKYLGNELEWIREPAEE